MATIEQTSARIASIAARGMKKPESLTLAEIKAVCASANTQARPKKSLIARLLQPLK